MKCLDEELKKPVVVLSKAFSLACRVDTEDGECSVGSGFITAVQCCLSGLHLHTTPVIVQQQLCIT